MAIMECLVPLKVYFGEGPFYFITPSLLRRLPPIHLKTLCSTLDKLGELSAEAQQLLTPITISAKFFESSHHLYLYAQPSSETPEDDTKRHDIYSTCIRGLLRVGEKDLYLYNEHNPLNCYRSLCVLDFYVHASVQRHGIGLKLFKYMLHRESETIQFVSPELLAYDRPSPKLLSFLKKHFNLEKPVEQANHYIIYNAFFHSSRQANSVRSRRSHAPSAPSLPTATVLCQSKSNLSQPKCASRRRWDISEARSKSSTIHSLPPWISEKDSLSSNTDVNNLQSNVTTSTTPLTNGEELSSFSNLLSYVPQEAKNSPLLSRWPSSRSDPKMHSVFANAAQTQLEPTSSPSRFYPSHFDIFPTAPAKELKYTGYSLQSPFAIEIERNKPTDFYSSSSAYGSYSRRSPSSAPSNSSIHTSLFRKIS